MLQGIAGHKISALRQQIIPPCNTIVQEVSERSTDRSF
jgi:hypothetical protein